MSTRVLRKRPARACSPSPSPRKPATGNARKRARVVLSDSESDAESSDDDQASEYGNDEDDDDKENREQPVTPRGRRGAVAVTPTSTPRRGRSSARTPTKKTPTKRVVSASPTKRLAKLSLAPATNTLLTPPTTPPDEQPAKPVQTNPYARARAALRSDTRPEQLSGRDNERLELFAYLRSSAPKSLYISGQPGTGKTALIRETLAAYQEEEADWDGEVRKVYVNCVGRKEEAVWDAILEAVSGNSLPKSPSKRKRELDGRGTFERWLGQSDAKCILVLDEIDHLSTSSGVLAAVFALPAAHPSVLRVVAISNSHTLAARTAGVATLHFQPYDAKAMAEIARTRLADSSSIFMPAVLALASTRVAGLSGDVRTLVAVLVRAVDAAEAKGAPTVGPPHFLEAWKSLAPKPVEKKAPVVKKDIFMTSSATSSFPAANNAAPRVAVGLALQPKLALLSLIVAKRRLGANLSLGVLATGFSSPSKRSAFARTPSFGSPSKRSTSPMKRATSFACPSSPTKRSHTSIDANALHAFYGAVVARSSPLSTVSRTEFLDVLAVLEGCGAAHVDAGCVEVGEGVRVEDILGNEGADADVEDGLLRALWDKETRRVEREISDREIENAPKDAMEE